MKKQTSHDSAASQYVPPDKRRAQGKTLREAVPREAHGHWKPAKDRRDIADLLNEANEGRMLQLSLIKLFKTTAVRSARRSSLWPPTDHASRLRPSIWTRRGPCDAR
jgi:hypothetical protein